MAQMGTRDSVSSLRRVLGYDDSKSEKEVRLLPEVGLTKEQVDRVITDLTGQLAASYGDIPDWLMGRAQLTAICGPTSMFQVCIDLVSHMRGERRVEFTLEEAAEALELILNKTEEQLKVVAPNHYPDMMAPKLCFFLSVMRHLGVNSVKTLYCMGCCPGIFVTMQYWM